MRIEKHWHRFFTRFVENFNAKFPGKFCGTFHDKGKAYRVIIKVKEIK